MTNSITVVGLGPGDSRFVTEQTVAEIESAQRCFLRTTWHPCASFAKGAQSFDRLYEKHDRFEDVYAAITAELIQASEQDDVLYIVPGSPLILESTVRQLRQQTDVPITLLPAMSFLDVVWNQLKIDPIDEAVTLIDAFSFERDAAGSSGPFLVAHTYAPWILSDIKLSVEADDENVLFLQRLGTKDEKITEVSWHDLDRSVEPDHLTSLYIPQLQMPAGKALHENVLLMRTLREKCPWDQEQTHQSLAKYLREESSEVIEAIESLDPQDLSSYADLEEELGDVWLQVLFHSQLASESGHFTITDVANQLQEKMVRRHPHVFGDSDAVTMDELSEQWQEIKEQEKRKKSR